MGLSTAVVAPTGVALAESPVAEAQVSAFSHIREDAQRISIDAEKGSSFSPVARGAFTVYVTPKPTPKPVAARVAGGLPRYTGGGAPAEWMAAAGIAPDDRAYVDYIVRRESGWNPNATNKRSGACGLVQALPCSKVPGNGYNPVDNLRWADGYAKGRYGSWEKAYQFWVRNHWW